MRRQLEASRADFASALEKAAAVTCGRGLQRESRTEGALAHISVTDISLHWAGLLTTDLLTRR